MNEKPLPYAGIEDTIYSMIYDTFQKKAIDCINEGSSVIVSAPTGAGKTAIAEYIITECLEKNERVIYTAPIKALSNQKFRDFHEAFPDRIGILTGDVTINPDAAVLIMTTEIFRNKILERESSLAKYSWIIFDEVHYMDDYERGTVWEESLMFMPRHMRVLALSATIPNIEEIASWLKTVHGMPLKVVKEKDRPVPLHFFYQVNGEIVDNLRRVRSIAYTKKHLKYHMRPNRPTALIKHLLEADRLPCIYFVFGRKRAEYLADEISRFDFLTPEEKITITNLFNKLCERFDLSGDKSAHAIFPLLKRGIAYHHAGMLPTLKEVIERLFTSRLIKVIFTTETFALGINMPSRSVIFDELRKYYGHSFATLKTRDFYQMAGRAGRRGIDREGFVYSRVNPRWISLEELQRVVYGEPEKVKSRFNASYATLLNLYERHEEKLYEIYPLSFHYFQARRHIRKKALDLMYNKVKLLKDLGYIRKNEAPRPEGRGFFEQNTERPLPICDLKAAVLRPRMYKLTEKGLFASKIYGYELALSELYERSLLEYLSEGELAVLSTALVFEPRKATVMPERLSRQTRHLKNITDDVVNNIQRQEKRLGIRPVTKPYYFHLSASVEAWIKGEKFDNILKYTSEDEGGVIRNFRMAIQVLRELLDTPVSHVLKERIKNTLRLMNRDVIDAERQLRG